MKRIFFRWVLLFEIIFLVSLIGIKEGAIVNPSLSQEKPSSATESGKINQVVISEKQIVPTVVVSSPQPTEEWGKAKQIDEHTWTMQVGDDEQMASAQEILSALNMYRNRHGSGSLSWDAKLANYANERAVYFVSIGNLDGHAGFSDYLNNQDGFTKLGFSSLGENSSFGYRLSGVHLIEWVYAGDEPHNVNQLNAKWKYVGIGVSGTATNLVFGGERL